MAHRKEGYAVITGASSGIGAEFARQLSDLGYPLILIARDRAKLFALKQTLNTECRIMTADLATTDGCRKVIRGLRRTPVAIFINNAGFGDCGAFTETKTRIELDMIDVNVKAMHYLMKGMLKKMTKAGRGSILNVASSAGLLPAGPYMATYYATKAYVTSLTRGVAEELRQQGSPIYVGCLCPGPVDTNFNQVANVRFALRGISAKRCVREALYGMAMRRVTIVPTASMKLATMAGRMIPVPVAVRITSHQQRKKLG